MASWRLTRLVLWLVFQLLQLNYCGFLCEVYHEITGVSWCSSGDLVNFCFSIYRLVANPCHIHQGLFLVYPNSGEAINYLLLLCGDISINPGPIRYPCTVCSRSVKSNQKGILCDSCGKWSHSCCVGISDQKYTSLSTAVDFCWQCPSCLFSVLPNLDVYDSPTASSDETLNPTISDTLSVFEMLSPPFSDLRLINHNIQGLCSKLDEISYWLSQCSQTNVVFCCSETWMKPQSILPSISGFTTILSPVHSRLGDCCQRPSFLPGSCIIISDNLQVHRPDVCSVIEQCNTLNVASCFIKLHHLQVAIVSVYRPPSTNPQMGLEDLQYIFTHLSSMTSHFVLAGDLNIDLLQTSSVKYQYSDLLVDFHLVQRITQPSRYSSASATLINHVISKYFIHLC